MKKIFFVLLTTYIHVAIFAEDRTVDQKKFVETWGKTFSALFVNKTENVKSNFEILRAEMLMRQKQPFNELNDLMKQARMKNRLKGKNPILQENVKREERDSATSTIKKLSLGQSNVSVLLSEESNFNYVDKTSIILKLIESEGRGAALFLSRPRRFGRTLLLTTLEAIFRGNKELFRGTAIYSSSYEWTTYPVFYFDFSQIDALDYDHATFEKKLNETLLNQAKLNNISLSTDVSPKFWVTRMRELLNKCNKEVIILVDEYDFSLTNFHDNPERLVLNRQTMNSFFTSINDHSSKLRFILVTGVNKFRLGSVWAGHILKDISMNEEYATLLGYTEDEFRSCYAANLEHLRQNELEQMSSDDIIKTGLKKYKGYHFSRYSEIFVLSPQSLMCYIRNGKPETYWAQSTGEGAGVPRYVFQELKRRGASSLGTVSLDHPVNVSDSTLSETWDDITDLSTITLLYNVGFLTIRKYYKLENLYEVVFANDEVKEGFKELLSKEFLGIQGHLIFQRYLSKIKKHLVSFEITEFVHILNLIFSNISKSMYSISDTRAAGKFVINKVAADEMNCDVGIPDGVYEKTFRNILWLIILLGTTEEEEHIGWRLGMVGCIRNVTVVFELQQDETGEIALNEIDKNYMMRPLKASSRKIIAVGLNFDTKVRLVNDWKARLSVGENVIDMTQKPNI